MRHALFLHGSADLYGSSKILISTVSGLDKSRFRATVILPYAQTLDKELEKAGARVVIGPLAVMRRQDYNLRGIFIFIRDLVKSLILIRRLDRECPVDLVYTSTIVILSGAVYAKLFKKRHIFHAMEIATKPPVLGWLMPRLVKLFADRCIAISEATKAYIASGGMKAAAISVVHSGTAPLERKGTFDPSAIRRNHKVFVGMVGRFLWWKGQDLFVRAARLVVEAGGDVDFVMVGSYFGNQRAYYDDVRALIEASGLGSRVQILEFVDDIAALYDALDVLVVPSTQPEPFGMVSVEAMSRKKAVIASDIGGSVEIVVDGKTGLLFRAGDAADLKDAVLKLAADDGLRRAMGEAGFARQQALFTEKKYQEEVCGFISGEIAAAERMKIAVMGIRGVPANYSGFETFAEELSVRLVRKGHEVTVYGRPHYVTVRERVYKGIRIVIVPTIRHKYLDTVFHTFLCSLHVIFTPVQVIYYCNPINAVFTVIPRIFGKKTIINVDGLEWKRSKWNALGKAMHRFSERLATVLPDRIVADSMGIHDYYKERYGKDSDYISYGAYIKERIPPGPFMRQHGLRERGYVLYVGRLEPENNAHVLVAAYEKVKGDMPLVIVGDAPYGKDYIKKLRSTRDRRIQFLGGVFGEGYYELLSNAFIYIHTNEVGGTNPALLQAMASGNCTLVNGVVFNKEVIGDSGLWYIPGDIDDIRKKIEYLIDHPEEVDRYRKLAPERIRKYYNWDDVADKTESLMIRLLRR